MIGLIFSFAKVVIFFCSHNKIRFKRVFLLDFAKMKQ